MRGCFALRNLVLVVREHEVFAAGVQVERFAEVLHGHGGALDVPAGAAGAERRLPGCLAGLGGLPKSEITGGVLLVLVEVDAGAVFHAVQVFLRELAVAGEASDAEVPATVLGFVGDVLGGEALDERDHAVDVFCSACDLFGAFDAQGVHVFKEGALVLGAVLADGLAGSGCVANDLVVDVGDVHDVMQAEAIETGGAAQGVDVQKGAEVADVAVVIDRGAATVEAQGAAVGGKERFDFSGEGVEEFEGHASFNAAGRDASRRTAGYFLLLSVPSDSSRDRALSRVLVGALVRACRGRSCGPEAWARRRRRSWRRCRWRARWTGRRRGDCGGRLRQ